MPPPELTTPTGRIDDDAAAEARASLIRLTELTYPRYVAEPFHWLVADALEAVLRGETRRLMIFSPPQSGKSELVSVRFPAFWLGHRPDDPIILTSYGASLAHSKSWEARACVESPAFARVFPGVLTDQTSRAREFWRIAGRRGSLLAAGVGGPVAGHGAFLGVIDDPLENWQQAHSEAVRDRVWNWYRSTFRTRIWEDGAIILVTTRWHETDLAGRLLRDQADRWDVLRLPAIAESQDERDANDVRLGLQPGGADPLGRAPGEPLCPARFSLAALAGIRADVGSFAWSAEYQGVPRAMEGGLFRRDWFEIVGTAPADGADVRYWDLAATEKKAGGGDPDWTVGLRLSRSNGRYYVKHLVRLRGTPARVEDVIRQTAVADGPDVRVGLEQEPGASGKAYAAHLVRMLDGFPARGFATGGADKTTRAMLWQGQAEAGNVALVNGPWVQAFLDEAESFPEGAHDDVVDALSGAYKMLAAGPAQRVDYDELQGGLVAPSRWTASQTPRWRRGKRR